LPDFLSGYNRETRQVSVPGLHTIAVVDYDDLAVLTAPGGMCYDTIPRGVHWGTPWRGKIHAGVHRTVAGKRIAPATEGTDQSSVDRPQTRPYILLKTTGVIVIARRNGSRLKEVVLFERFAICGSKRTQFCYHIGRITRFIVDAIRHGNF